ncbi:hypothetical protein QFC21_005988 [Naganishia friedmannii]|uniref:Uncharacterized protein n=1 Tax=Naganishia friedmannii TaxID=89922 RepID=A0ACC2V529_9TREE|nr:hypothetical protein QFC21_005988 [Naganishia friedmannii]
MGFRSVDLHASALSPAEYTVYTPILARLLEKHIGSKDSEVVARKDFQTLLQAEWSIAESQLQSIFTRLPSYPSSQIPVGEIYATLRLLAHDQQSPKATGKSHSTSGVSQDELVFIQCKPLALPSDKQSSHSARTAKKPEDVMPQKDRILTEPLQPPPRRQTSLKVPSSVKPPVHSSPVRHVDHTEPSAAVDTHTSPHAGASKRSMHIKSKSTGTSTALPRSTPLLNPFRTAQASGQPGFVSPPPIPPKPSAKVPHTKPFDVQATTLLIAIEDAPEASVVDSNPFRKRLSAPGLSLGERMLTEKPHTSKPPLPPRVAPSHVEDFASPVRAVPDLAAPLEKAPSTSGSRSRGLKSETKRSTQPTSLLQPSRLIRESLMAAEQARSENHASGNSGRPMMHNPEYVPQTQRTWSGFKGSNNGDSDGEGSTFFRSKRLASGPKPKVKDRSGSLVSDTTDGVATSNSSLEDLTLNGNGRQSNAASTAMPNAVDSGPSPFDDPLVKEGPWPPPPKRNATIPALGARIPSSYDVIASSGDTDGETGEFGQGGKLSRRSTLKVPGPEDGNINSSSSFPPSIGTENILAVMSDLGEDVRRAAQGVGKDLEWLRGGRGGRSLGMTVPAPDDHGGDGRRGLMTGIGKNDTGSTAASSDF